MAKFSTHYSLKKPEAGMRALSILLLTPLSPLMAFSPVLNSITPCGGQRGTEIEVHFHGERLAEINGAVFHQPGLILNDLVVQDDKHAVAKLSIAADAALGEYSLRLHGPGGLTELRTFWVGQFPTVREVEPNATFDNAQRIALNSTVEGVAGTEDDDYYICSLKKGQRLSVEVEAMRLGRVMFDAYVAIIDPRKFELASCDDTPLLRNDAFASIIAPADGDYRIVVHEAAYEGNDQCQYRLHIGTFPRPKAVFPSGGKPGELIDFTFIGDPSGPIKQSITLPVSANGRFPIFPQHEGLSAPSPHWITVSALESVSESSANPNATFSTAAATPAIPFAIHGILDGDAKADWFKFTALKNQDLVIRVLARSHRSPIDSVISIHQADRKALATNDDQGGPDSTLSWTCPADGEYRLQVRDQLSRTGADFTYRIEVTQKSPSIAATLPTVERVNSQKWKTFPIPRGNRYAAVINLTRENIACDCLFGAAALPPGVTLHTPPIPRSVTTFPVVFEAAPDAPVAAGLYSFFVHTTGDAPDLTGSLTDTIHHVDINNEGAYHSATFDRIATAVTVEAPLQIELCPPPVAIVKNGTLGLKIRILRQPDFSGKITVRFLWNPPGVSGPVSMEIPSDQNEIFYELNASADATVGDWQVCMLAEADTPRGPVLVSSALTPLKVADPYLGMTLDLAATVQGKSTAMLAKIEVLRPFEGSATVELLGLPQGATCPAQTFTRNQTELIFPLAIATDAKVGKHNGIFCRVTLPENGSHILHQTAMGSTLRIDAASEAPSVKNTASPTPEKSADEPARPLSRLEQLREHAVKK